MSKFGKISLLVFVLSMVVVLATRFILSGWVNVLFVPLGVAGIALVATLILEMRTLIEFFTMRTTKHGMNMGVLILLVSAILVSVNFLAVRNNKTYDFTEGKINSLAEQTIDVIRKMDGDVNVRVFYRGQKDAQSKEYLREVLNKYKDVSRKLKIYFHDSYVENAMAMKYLKDLPDPDQVIVFFEKGTKRIRVGTPFDEEQLTSALVKATRKDSKVVYFLTGHGERDIESDAPEGVKTFISSLESSSFMVKKLNLLEGGSIPPDAAMLAIVGLGSKLFSTELNEIKRYLADGGKLLLAADPGERHNVSELTNILGVQFANNFIFNDQIRLFGKGAATALGLVFDKGSDITKKFRSGDNFTVFEVASEIKPLGTKPDGFQITEIIKTPPNSYARTTIDSEEQGEERLYTLAAKVTGSLASKSKGEKSKAAEFAAVVFGDSDFMANKDFFQGLNRDLAMNSVAYLTKESDLISIRPKQPKGSKIEITQTTRAIILVSAVLLPLVLLVLGGVLWFRRRGA